MEQSSRVSLTTKENRKHFDEAYWVATVSKRSRIKISRNLTKHKCFYQKCCQMECIILFKMFSFKSNLTTLMDQSYNEREQKNSDQACWVATASNLSRIKKIKLTFVIAKTVFSLLSKHLRYFFLYINFLNERFIVLFHGN